MIYQEMENSLDQKNRNFTPNFIAKVGVRYDSLKGWDAGIFDAYYGAPEDLHNFNPNVLKVNPAPESYNMLTANLNVDIPRFLGKEEQMPEMTFTLFGKNLLDEDIYYPELSRATINSIPIEGGRAIYGRLTINF